MTLVVARIAKGRIAIAADTMISAHDALKPMREWALKSICLPGNICVSYSGSPELARQAFRTFYIEYPNGTNRKIAIDYFKLSSIKTCNDYIVAFCNPAQLITIRDGICDSGLSKTHWIGDREGYNRFREYENLQRSTQLQGRAVNAALFADEMDGSPASDLYSAMRNLVNDQSIPSVGGFVSVISNRDAGFRFSVYSDVLFDWPNGLQVNQNINLIDKFDLASSGENDEFSISQISPGYCNINTVAFYLLKGKILVIFCQKNDGEHLCMPISNVHPDKISETLNEKLDFDFRAMCLVMSGRKGTSNSGNRTNSGHGLSIGLFCEVNTLKNIIEQ